MKQRLIILLILAASFGACNKGQLPQQSLPVEQTVSSQEFSFVAQTANPMGGTSVRLGPGWDLVVRKDSLIATLPFYGRAYAPVDMNGGGIRFDSRRFRYSATADGKGGWEILMTPEDVPGIVELRLSVSADGYGTLYVTSQNRQAISFYGELRK